MSSRLNRIIVGDCIRRLRDVPEGVVDLAFADPPFNIGYEYDRYHDSRPPEEYIDWSKDWMAAVKRVLKPNGAFWLAIGDEYAAELKVIATRELGLFCRSWVVWYYTFGVHCESKFTRSHAHLFHFVVDPAKFTFNNAAIRVPSARQLIYADKRANPRGRVPDDTWIIQPVADASWILRPQDLPDGFSADSDSWYFPRVCGTFRERMGFHGCQMPEQLLGRILRACTIEGDLVLDPFVGSGTTLAVAKKLGRQFLGIELSADYAKQAKKRIDSVKSGDKLDGAENPLSQSVSKPPRRLANSSISQDNSKDSPSRKRTKGLTDFEREIINAFESVRCEYSTDRVIADPFMNGEFISLLESRGVEGEPLDWNMALLRIRKANRLKTVGRTKRTDLDETKIEQCEFAAEIALRQIQDQDGVVLDTLLCAPALAQKFDQLAAEICPGLEPLYYRWAALRIRKYSKKWRDFGSQVGDEVLGTSFSSFRLLSSASFRNVPESPGLYVLKRASKRLYVGDTKNLAIWFKQATGSYNFSALGKGSPLRFAVRPLEPDRFAMPQSSVAKGAKSVLIAEWRPEWNLADLAVA